MATRERKPRNATDSPLSESAPSTPTAPKGRPRGARGTRGKSRARTASDTTNNDDNESTQSLDGAEDQQSGKQTPQPPPARTPSRASTKEESEDNSRGGGEENNSKAKSSPIKVTPSPATTSSTTTPATPKPRRSRNTKATVAAAAAAVQPTTAAATRSKNPRASAGVVRRGGGVVKRRRSLPGATPRRRRGPAERRSLPAAKVIKAAVAQLITTPPGIITTPPQLTAAITAVAVVNEKPSVPVRKRRAAPRKPKIVAEKHVFKKPAGVELPDNGSATDTELTSVRRRRSSSKSTDTVASCPEILDATVVKKEELILPTLISVVKSEAAADEELPAESGEKQSILDKMAENFCEAKVEDIKIGQLKRAGRPKRSTVGRPAVRRSKEIKKPAETKQITTPDLVMPEPLESVEKLSEGSLKIETEEIKILAGAELQKDSSLSPQLDSEGVSEISVKTFYGEPAFLENNLGIEKDPKLGEIVQVQKTVASVTEKELSPSTSPPPPSIAEVSTTVVATGKLIIDAEPIIEEAKPDLEENKENTSVSVVVVEQICDENKLIEIVEKSESLPSPPTMTIADSGDGGEAAELLKEKEKHFLSLGLLTHEAAVEAEKQKLKMREMRFRNGSSKSEKRNRHGSTEYTGTLKTIIKLNRTSPEKRKNRMPLKMTIHKGKPKHNRGERDLNGTTSVSEPQFYIQTEKQVCTLNFSRWKANKLTFPFISRGNNNKKVCILKKKKVERAITVLTMVCV